MGCSQRCTHTYAFLIVIKFSFTIAWLQPRAAASQVSSPQSRTVSGQEALENTGMGLCSLPSAPQGSLTWAGMASPSILPAKSLSFQDGSQDAR